MGRTDASKTDTRELKTISITDPAINAAVSTDILDTYSGVIITTTTTGNAQTLQTPTNTDLIKRFSVVNNDTSTDTISINGTDLAVGAKTDFIWDGTAWTSAGGGTPGDTLPVIDTTAIVKGSVDATKTMRFEVDGLTTGTTRVLTPLDKDYTIGDVTLTGTGTLANKRITERVNTIASSATPTPVGDTTDEFTVTALATGATFAAPTGTPTEGQKLIIRIKDNGTARTLAWNTIYRESSDLTLPTTTIISKTIYMGFIYNFTDSKWDFVALLDNF